MGTALHQVLTKMICSHKFCFLNMSKHCTMQNSARVGWSQPTAPESTNSPRVNQQPLFISSYPCFRKRTTVCCTALLLSLHDFPRLVALTFVVWTLHTFEEHKANEKISAQLGHCIFWGCLRPPHQSWAIKEPSPLLGCPTPGTAASPCATSQDGESQTGQHGCSRLSPRCFN